MTDRKKDYFDYACDFLEILEKSGLSLVEQRKALEWADNKLIEDEEIELKKHLIGSLTQLGCDIALPEQLAPGSDKVN